MRLSREAPWSWCRAGLVHRPDGQARRSASCPNGRNQESPHSGPYGISENPPGDRAWLLQKVFSRQRMQPRPYYERIVRGEVSGREPSKEIPAANLHLQMPAQPCIVDNRYSDDRASMPKQKLNPLPAAAFQILLALASEDLHGYGIMRQVAEQTGGRMRLGPGTLYSSIQTLVEAKLIEETAAREDAKLGGERRRYYRLTSAGRKLARSEAERLADLLRVARSKKILRGEYV